MSGCWGGSSFSPLFLVFLFLGNPLQRDLVVTSMYTFPPFVQICPLSQKALLTLHRTNSRPGDLPRLSSANVFLGRHRASSLKWAGGSTRPWRCFSRRRARPLGLPDRAPRALAHPACASSKPAGSLELFGTGEAQSLREHQDISFISLTSA